MANESTEERLAHAKYEYGMARYAYEQLHTERDQLRWNVALAAFGVFFRNTRNFLKSEGDQNSIKAKHYVKHFTAKSAEELKDEIGALHAEVLHLGVKRTSNEERKLGFAAAEKLMRWLVANVKLFESQLEEADKALWTRDEPEGLVRETPPQATNHITHTTLVLGPMKFAEFVLDTNKGK